MTLNEAIIHACESANRIEKEGCVHCANEHRQLAGWLEELKEYKNGELQPIRHGHWTPKETMIRSPFAKNYYCSECFEDTVFGGNYCSNCGAKMDLEI